MLEFKVFKCEVDRDGQKVEEEFKMVLPNKDDHAEAQKIYNKRFTEALNSGAFLRIKLDEIARQQGLWDDTKETKLRELSRDISEHEKVLAKGGIPLSSARQRAIAIRRLRNEMKLLILARASIDPHSAEAQAEAAQFDYFVSKCLVYNSNGEQYFTDLDDFYQQQAVRAKIVTEAINTLSDLMYGEIEEIDESAPENKFLKEFGFVNNKGKLVNQDGHLVDEDGRLINEDGRFVNDKGEFIDIDGNLLDADGQYKCDFVPFLDDEGNEVQPVGKKKTKKKTVQTVET